MIFNKSLVFDFFFMKSMTFFFFFFLIFELCRPYGKIGMEFTIDTDFVSNFFDSEGKVGMHFSF